MVIAPVVALMVIGAVSLDQPLLTFVLGALGVLVPGGIFAALRYRREDDGAVVEQSKVVTDAAVDVITELRTELNRTRADLAEEREARQKDRRETTAEMESLRTELHETRDRLNETKDEVVRLRRTLAARGTDDA